MKDYYQELKISMLHCGLVENEEASMARFLGGLNREIQDILDYKDYNSITRLFLLACKAERELQGHQTRTRSNSSAGHTNSWTPRTPTAPSTIAPSPLSSNNRQRPTTSS